VRGRARAAAAVARWRTAEPRGGVARAREGQGGGARAVARLGATCGGEGSKRWNRGGAGAAVSSSDDRQQRSRGAGQVLEEEEEGRGSQGLPWNLQKSQGSHYVLNFPTDPKL
jgi:hypothetical protein